MAAIIRVANALRRIGQQNSPGGQDSVLAYINQKEKRKLMADGGAGTPDPVTGIPHFWQANDGGDTDTADNTDPTDNTPEGRQPSDAWKKETDAELKDFLDQQAKQTGPLSSVDEKGNVRTIMHEAGRNEDGSINSGDPNTTKLLGAKQPFTDAQIAALSTPGVDNTIGTASSFSFGKAVRGFFKGMATGNLALASANALREGYVPGTEGTVYGAAPTGETQTQTAENDGNNLDEKQKQTAAAAASVPTIDANGDTTTITTTAPATSDIDLFSTLSRNRYNRKNQMLGGLLNVSGVTVAKPTLGV